MKIKKRPVFLGGTPCNTQRRKIKWADDQEAVTFLGCRPTRS
jgi:hypothetical protein